MKINPNDKRAYLGTLLFMAYDREVPSIAPRIEAHKKITGLLRSMPNEHIAKELDFIEEQGISSEYLPEALLTLGWCNKKK